MPALPPNIVWICADDFTPAMCGAYGNRIVRTPCLDRLASQGLRFDRAYCTCPLSTPSRQSFWTGRYPRSIGVTLSPTALPEDEITLPALLRRAGYQTAAFGKTHFYQPQRDLFDVCLDYPEYRRWFAAQARPIGSTIRTLGPWRPFFEPASVWLNSEVLPYAARDEDMFGTYLSRQAAAYLKTAAAAPFFLYVSYFETHSPFAFPVEFSGRHSFREFRAPRVSSEERRQVPPVFRRVTDEQTCGIQAAYATCTEFMDKNVGIVLDALAKSPAAENTIVLFTSDHGYLLGQHGRFEKHCCFEEALRAALIMRLPGERDPGRSTAALVQLLDLVPTVLELCGLPLPSHLQGQSLGPLLRNESSEHRQELFFEYSDNAEAAVLSGSWKAIYTSNGRRRGDGYGLESAQFGPRIQLFDHATDPEERTNLAEDPRFQPILARLLKRLAEHLVATDRLNRGKHGRGLREIFSACLTPVELADECRMDPEGW